MPLSVGEGKAWQGLALPSAMDRVVVHTPICMLRNRRMDMITGLPSPTNADEVNA